mmetsp:Transcript_109559/g.353591  ORF Transcript_109559/g.353591 Transcript_109559/m.353591 type:complete len:208 (-) Transcript_109559:1006-1629(-)
MHSALGLRSGPGSARGRTGSGRALPQLARAARGELPEECVAQAQQSALPELVAPLTEVPGGLLARAFRGLLHLLQELLHEVRRAALACVGLVRLPHYLLDLRGEGLATSQLALARPQQRAQDGRQDGPSEPQLRSLCLWLAGPLMLSQKPQQGLLLQAVVPDPFVPEGPEMPAQRTQRTGGCAERDQELRREGPSLAPALKELAEAE